MANEAVIIELLGCQGDVISYTVADGTAITKGTILKISSDPRTAAASAGASDVFAGIAASDKVANDGQVNIGVYTNGIFDMTNSVNAGITLGALVTISGANLIRAAVAGDILTGSIVGKCLETASSSEVVAIKIGGNC